MYVRLLAETGLTQVGTPKNYIFPVYDFVQKKKQKSDVLITWSSCRKKSYNSIFQDTLGDL